MVKNKPSGSCNARSAAHVSNLQGLLSFVYTRYIQDDRCVKRRPDNEAWESHWDLYISHDTYILSSTSQASRCCACRKLLTPMSS